MSSDFVPPENDRFSVKELAKHWRISASRVNNYIYSQKTLRLAIAREWILELSSFDSSCVLIKNYLEGGKQEIHISAFPKFLYIDRKNVEESYELVRGKRTNVWTFSIFQDFEGKEFFFTEHGKCVGIEPEEIDEFGSRLSLTMRVESGRPVITREERDKFESENSYHNKISNEILNRRHRHYSSELAIAIEIWLQLKDVENSKKTPKTLVAELLHRRYRDRKLSESAKTRIETMINWNKSGGAPKSN